MWEDDTTFVALLRAAMTSPTAAETMRQVFATQVAPRWPPSHPTTPPQRAGLMGAFIIGLATTRYVLANPAVADLSHDELIRWASPVIRQLLVGPPPDRFGPTSALNSTTSTRTCSSSEVLDFTVENLSAEDVERLRAHLRTTHRSRSAN